MRNERRIWLLGLSMAASLVGGLPGLASAQSVTVDWNGVLEFIDFDSETGALTGGTEGASPFAGYFVHPTTCGAGCLVEPFPPDATNYVFADGSGLISGLGTAIQGVESSIEVIDEEVLDQDGVDFAAFFGIPATVGQTIDSWVLSSENDAEFTPAFVDWNITFIYLTTDPFASTGFVADPPPGPDLVVFEVNEDGGNVYAAVGTASVVPEPGFGVALAASTIGLVVGCPGRQRRSRR